MKALGLLGIWQVWYITENKFAKVNALHEDRMNERHYFTTQYSSYHTNTILARFFIYECYILDTKMRRCFN